MQTSVPKSAAQGSGPMWGHLGKRTVELRASSGDMRTRCFDKTNKRMQHYHGHCRPADNAVVMTEKSPTWHSSCGVYIQSSLGDCAVERDWDMVKIPELQLGRVSVQRRVSEHSPTLTPHDSQSPQVDRQTYGGQWILLATANVSPRQYHRWRKD